MALLVEYDGWNYHGFQCQRNFVTIQEEIENSIKKFTKETLRVRAAGRTDAKVHAIGQVVVFDTESDYDTCTITKALNSYLPRDIAVLETHRVSCDFDPRRHALSRTYVYSLFNGDVHRPLNRKYSGLVRGKLDVEMMKRGASTFIGTHDFERFAASAKENSGSFIRTIYKSEIYNESGMVKYVVEGSSFLTHQVRRMVGALVSLGKGRITMSQLNEMIDNKGTKVAQTMAPEGLCLIKVKYENFPFKK